MDKYVTNTWRKKTRVVRPAPNFANFNARNPSRLYIGEGHRSFGIHHLHFSPSFHHCSIASSHSLHVNCTICFVISMGRAPCCDKTGPKKGPWTPEEDLMLTNYIQIHGPGNWRTLPKNAGIKLSPSSYLHYLSPVLQTDMMMLLFQLFRARKMWKELPSQMGKLPQTWYQERKVFLWRRRNHNSTSQYLGQQVWLESFSPFKILLQRKVCGQYYIVGQSFSYYDDPGPYTL